MMGGGHLDRAEGAIALLSPEHLLAESDQKRYKHRWEMASVTFDTLDSPRLHSGA